MITEWLLEFFRSQSWLHLSLYYLIAGVFLLLCDWKAFHDAYEYTFGKDTDPVIRLTMGVLFAPIVVPCGLVIWLFTWRKKK